VRLRSLAVAAAVTAALIAGIATPGQAAPAPLDHTDVSASPDTAQTLIAYTADNKITVYAEGVEDVVTPVRLVSNPAGPMMLPKSIKDCGVATCSIYMSRSETAQAHRDIALYGGGLGGLAGACTILALIPVAGVALAIACGIGLPVYGGFLLNAMDHAYNDHRCLRIRYTRLGGGYTFYSDGGKYCRD
jgi:hypothetical protein